MKAPRALQPAKQPSQDRGGRGELAANHRNGEYLPSPDDALRPPPGTPWFTAIRSEEAWELLLSNRNAFVLAYVIGYRARWKDGFNRHGLDHGEAMLGDWEAYGMTEQEYRTSKEQLAKWGFATFRATNKGTIGKLVDTRLFSLLPPVRNDQSNEQTTNKQRTGNGRVTTTGRREEGKTVKTGNTVAGKNHSSPGDAMPSSFIPGVNSQ